MTLTIFHRLALGIFAAAIAVALAIVAPDPRGEPAAATGRPHMDTARASDIGINLFGLEPSNREQVFTNLIAQSRWFIDTGRGWTLMPESRLDADGWIRQLAPNEVAPRPLVLPPAPFDHIAVRCTYSGDGALSAGGIAETTATSPGVLDFDLHSRGAADEGAWIRLDRSNPAKPVRDIDCRDRTRPPGERISPAFIQSLKGFAAVRFLDWQLTNLNPAVSWAARTRPESASQVTGDGVAIELMVQLANQAQVDPWFLMPYKADPKYITEFAKCVHTRLGPNRTVYVELGNEMWNDMFDATQQAEREGLAAGLAPSGDGNLAKTLRYGQKARAAMEIWSRIYADHPNRLVRVLAVQNVEPAMALQLLNDVETSRSFDALATAPYFQLDLRQRTLADLNWVFAKLPAQIDSTISFAAQTRALARAHGKRFIAYEGGQHLVTENLPLARAIQRDPRMAQSYRHYLEAWRTRIGDRLMLYASTAPIAEYGSWGLREYAGQPERETPKLRAVRSFLTASR